MAYKPTDPYRTPRPEDDMSRPARLDNELQPDPVLEETGPSTGKIAAFAVAIALVLGALFYGMNNSSVTTATTDSARTAQTQPATPSTSPGMRDVTPRTNSEPGTTTGAAPARPDPEPAAPQTDSPGAKQ